MIFYLLVIYLLGVSNANLVPWNTTDCFMNQESCRGTPTTNRPCEIICKGSKCSLRVGIILPENDTYIVNIQKANEELENALKESRRRRLIPDELEVEYISLNDQCEQAYATISTIDAYSEHCAHVIFGPICDYCVASAGRTVKFLGEYGTPLITSGGFVFDFVLKKIDCNDEFYMLINAGSVDYLSLSEFFYHIMVMYGWKKIALMYEKYDQNEVGGDQGCQLLMKSVIEVLKNNMNDYQYFDGDISLLNVTYDAFLKRDVGVKFGIILICASHSNTRNLLIEAHKIKMAEGEYVFLNFDLYNNAPHPSTPWYDPEDSDENNEKARKAYKYLLTFTPWTEAIHAERNETSDGRRGALYLDGIFDGWLLYSYALNQTLQMDENGNIKRNKSLPGVEVVNKMFGYNFKGKNDENITMNCNGQRLAKYALMQMDEFGKEFYIVASYTNEDKSMKILKDIKWMGGTTLPGDTPKCGYDHSLCPMEPTSNVTLIVICSITSLFIIICTILVYRHYKLESEIASMNWKISFSDIRMGDERGNSQFSIKRGSLISLVSDSCSMVGDHVVYGKVGYYRDIRVAIKVVNRDSKIELSRNQLKELKTMKDLSNDHLVKFHGSCLESLKCYIVTEYCPRGSLQDVLEYPGAKIDWEFSISLVHDIIRGMQYLHHSDIKYHGSLKSSNCVVDSRFVVKITDFGLNFLREEKYVEKDTHAYWQKKLWTAPEILKLEKYQNVSIQDWQKADVYSFAIIVHEIVTMQGVFYLGENDISKEEC